MGAAEGAGGVVTEETEERQGSEVAVHGAESEVAVHGAEPEVVEVGTESEMTESVVGCTVSIRSFTEASPWVLTPRTRSDPSFLRSGHASCRP